jgi:hypothetical protein
MIVLSKKQVKHLHKKLLERTGGLDGMRDENLLESALMRESLFCRPARHSMCSDEKTFFESRPSQNSSLSFFGLDVAKAYMATTTQTIPTTQTIVPEMLTTGLSLSVSRKHTGRTAQKYSHDRAFVGQDGPDHKRRAHFFEPIGKTLLLHTVSTSSITPVADVGNPQKPCNSLPAAYLPVMAGRNGMPIDTWPANSINIICVFQSTAGSIRRPAPSRLLSAE